MSGRRRYTVWDIARIYTSVMREETLEGADSLLMGLILWDQRLREMWADLNTPGAHGLTPLEVAHLVFATRTAKGFPQLESALAVVLGIEPGAHRAHRHLEDLLEHSREASPFDLVTADEVLDGLITTEGWAEPPEVFALFEREPSFVDTLLAVCSQRLNRAEDPEERARLRTVLARLEVSVSLYRDTPRMTEMLVLALSDRTPMPEGPSPERAESTTDAIQNYSGWLRALADNLEESLLDEGDTHDQDL